MAIVWVGEREGTLMVDDPNESTLRPIISVTEAV